jgi:hypothetical protein
VSRDRLNPLDPQARERELQQRQLSRERVKVIGLLAIAVIIMVLAFLRYGSTIPWAAR